MICIIKNLFKKIIGKSNHEYDVDKDFIYLDISQVRKEVLDNNLSHLNKRRCFICDSIKPSHVLKINKDMFYFCPKCFKKITNKFDGCVYNIGGFANTMMILRYQHQDYLSKKKNKRKRIIKKFRLRNF